MFIRVVMIRENVMPRAMASRTPQQGNGVLCQVITGPLHMAPVFLLKGDVVHLLIVRLQKIDGVVVGTAAQEHEEVFDPVRHTEA